MLKKTLLSAALAALLVLPAVAVAPAQATTSVSKRWVGAWIPGVPGGMTALTTLEAQVGRKESVVHYFTNTMYGLDTTLLSKLRAHGSVPLVTLEFWNPAKGVSQPTLSLKKIAAGSLDSYLRTYARKAKAYASPIWLRPFHEMNGNWYPWGGTVNGNSPAAFVAAWRHVRMIFKAEGATNVKFVWCPNGTSVPNTTANAIKKYWPGTSYVDYMALDGYNWGGSSWASFSSIFGKAYSAVKVLSTKQIFIAETGSSEAGGNKAAWVSNMFKTIPTSFPRIVGVVWFDENKEHDWRITSSSLTLASFKVSAQSF